MAIFNCYVSSPEGNYLMVCNSTKSTRKVSQTCFSLKFLVVGCTKSSISGRVSCTSLALPKRVVAVAPTRSKSRVAPPTSKWRKKCSWCVSSCHSAALPFFLPQIPITGGGPHLAGLGHFIVHHAIYITQKTKQNIT